MDLIYFHFQIFFNIYHMMQHEVAHEGETGKAYRANFYDRLGRTVLISRPGMQVFY